MPVGPARGCFLPGSTVILSDGSSKNIEEINVGDSVISHDGTYNLVSNCLTYSVDEELVELEFEDGRTIRCTKDHEIFTNNRGWIAASEITEEDDVASVC
jgi:intein/homing endonuclease